MKQFLIFCFCLFAIISYSQSKVLFDYDAAGNRIMRYRVTSLNVADENNEVNLLGNKIESIENIGLKRKFESGDITISPNPTTDVVTVELKTKEPSSAKIILLDSSGKAIRNAENVSYIKEFDIGNLPSGTYYCRIETKSKAGIWKIIKAN